MTALILLQDFFESTVEFWLPIEGWPGYDVSSKGRVRSWYYAKPRIGRQGVDYVIGEHYRILRASPLKARERNHQVYDRHYIYREGKRSCFFTHRLVAKAFIANPNDWPEVNHKTGLGSDNRVDNIEWSTRSRNRQHAQDNGLVVMPKGMKWLTSKRQAGFLFTPDSVREIRRRVASGEMIIHVAAELHVHTETISRIVHRRRWAHVE